MNYSSTDLDKTNKRMLSDCFSAALQTSRKCGRYIDFGVRVSTYDECGAPVLV
ncbi:hypothetical protein SAMN04487951_10988 [Vreelandella arcis]|uniref:Uncharacterized protein n=1 Tax=Vreelandella arcis TaxID=416873 RepID=A0A1H0F258_9GAMM|nr:hypothetical protein SAMN04487951_10988 [Halomonas arcis]